MIKKKVIAIEVDLETWQIIKIKAEDQKRSVKAQTEVLLTECIEMGLLNKTTHE